ncbi:uncharacterized protein [Centruroides vittatus]|uniref:uncharacterized protein isoform X1 n=2 Tax=Centruroides vittatus TaxID=120091 RepID=UPI00350EADE5
MVEMDVWKNIVKDILSEIKSRVPDYDDSLLLGPRDTNEANPSGYLRDLLGMAKMLVMKIPKDGTDEKSDKIGELRKQLQLYQLRCNSLNGLIRKLQEQCTNQSEVVTSCIDFIIRMRHTGDKFLEEMIFKYEEEKTKKEEAEKELMKMESAYTSTLQILSEISDMAKKLRARFVENRSSRIEELEEFDKKDEEKNDDPPCSISEYTTIIDRMTYTKLEPLRIGIDCGE